MPTGEAGSPLCPPSGYPDRLGPSLPNRRPDSGTAGIGVRFIQAGMSEADSPRSWQWNPSSLVLQDEPLPPRGSIFRVRGQSDLSIGVFLGSLDDSTQTKEAGPFVTLLPRLSRLVCLSIFDKTLYWEPKGRGGSVTERGASHRCSTVVL